MVVVLVAGGLVWLVCWWLLVWLCSGLVVVGLGCTRFLRTQQCALKSMPILFVLSRAIDCFVVDGGGFFELVF